MNNRNNTEARIEILIRKFPALKPVISYRPVLWINDGLKSTDDAFFHLSKRFPYLNESAVRDAEGRLQRFAPLIAELFPETRESQGLIESDLKELAAMKHLLQQRYDQDFDGRLLLKCDSHLPVAGSVKARGGIYEVLKHAEDLALQNGMLKIEDDYSILANPSFRDFFSHYSLAVGSTGNLGLSIGITGAALGFKTVVHMSRDAKAWKKDLLRNKGVRVIEHDADYSKAVAAGRIEAQKNPHSYFVDDENSMDLFLGYSVAALRLKRQLAEMKVAVDQEHPLFVYLPCGVGGAPGGICYGLKIVFADHVHCFFTEPTHSPCMLTGLMTGEHEKLSVFDLGLDNLTDADGLAVGRPSGFAGRVAEELVSGIYTVEDHDLYRLLSLLADSEHIHLEPSATPCLLGPVMLSGSEAGKKYIKEHLEAHMSNAAHIAWATGGLFVPGELMQAFYEKGKELL
ncbi:MAG: D-serine ammonia-lyase [Syntrophomonas sp.]